MKTQLISILFFFFIPSLLISQEKFESLPNNWLIDVTSTRLNSTVGNGDKSSVELYSMSGYLISPKIKNIDNVTFFIRIAQFIDEYDLAVEYSRDKVNWVEKNSYPQRFDKNKYSEDWKNLFNSFTVNIKEEGEGYIRWSFKNYKSGTLLIDEISFAELSTTQIAQIVTINDISILKAGIDADIEMVTFNQAQAQFNNASESYSQNINLIVNLINKTRTIKITSETASKLATRNQMTNPMSYDGFKSIVENVKKYLPSVKKVQLSDILTLVQKPLQIADKVLLGGALSTFSNIFKNLVGDAFSPANLKEQKGFLEKTSDIEKSGLDIYNRTKTFLSVLTAENDKVNRLNLSIEESAVLSSNQLVELESFLIEYLKLTKIEDQELINSLSLGQKSAIDKAKELSIDFFTNSITTESFTKNDQKLTDIQKKILRTTTVYINKAELLKEKYEKLALKLLSFYNDFKSDVNSPNPFYNAETKTYLIDQATADTWAGMQQSIQTDFDLLISTFKRSYTEPNLYD